MNTILSFQNIRVEGDFKQNSLVEFHYISGGGQFQDINEGIFKTLVGGNFQTLLWGSFPERKLISKIHGRVVLSYCHSIWSLQW